MLLENLTTYGCKHIFIEDLRGNGICLNKESLIWPDWGNCIHMLLDAPLFTDILSRIGKNFVVCLDWFWKFPGQCREKVASSYQVLL